MVDSKLKRLENATKDLSWEDRERFDNCFIGALSMSVSDEVWDRALRAATRCMILPKA